MTGFKSGSGCRDIVRQPHFFGPMWRAGTTTIFYMISFFIDAVGAAIAK
jgi:hypothetical protein